MISNDFEVLTTLGEQIWMCDHEKQRCVKEEKYDQAKGFKIRRDEMKLRRDRQIDENLYQYGFRRGTLFYKVLALIGNEKSFEVLTTLSTVVTRQSSL